MKNDTIFYTLIAGFVSAIFISSFLNLGVSFFFWGIFISVVFLIYEKFLTKNPTEKSLIFLFALFIIFFSIGGIRYQIKDIKSADINLESNVGKKIFAQGVVLDEPDIKETSQTLVVKISKLIVDSTTNAVSEKMIVGTDLAKNLKYGDLIGISGKLSKPENFSSTILNSSSTKEFDYISYLAKDDIFYKIDFANVSVISGGNGNEIKSVLYKIKNSFISNVDRVISKPESSLLAGILLGEKGGMGKDLQDTFRIAGISHIVVLSGYNITIVSDVIMKTLSFLPRVFAGSLGVFGIILFIVMSGASSTAIRAGIMALIVILANILHKNYSAGRALVMAIVFMLFINPKILVFDISFELSCLATFAVIYISPILKNKMKYITDRFGLRDTVSSTLSAQILVLPLILNKMGILSYVALPTNIFVTPFVPATMFFGFIVGVVGFIFPIFSVPFAWVSYFLLFYIIKVSEFFAGFPFSWSLVPWFSAPIMVLSYILIGVWFLKESKKDIA